MTLLGGSLLLRTFQRLACRPPWPTVLDGDMGFPGSLPLGTTALFDVGVCLVVAGVVLMMIFSLAEES